MLLRALLDMVTGSGELSKSATASQLGSPRDVSKSWFLFGGFPNLGAPCWGFP